MSQLPKARSKMARLYKRTIHDETGTTTQYLERTKGGKAFRGWEVYEDGTRSDKFLLELGVLPIGYRPCEDDR